MALTPEARLWRTKGIGGSDARTIAGGNADDWLTLKREKIDGIRREVTKQQQLLMDLGNAVEPVALDYIDDHVLRIGKRDVRAMMEADSYFRATLDATSMIGDPIQTKFHTGDKSTEDLLEFYWPQLQHELLVTSRKLLLFVVVFGHYGRIDWTEVEADHKYQSEYMLRALRFKEFCWGSGELPDNMELTSLQPVIPRLRDHLWPEGDNRIAGLATLWIDSQEAADIHAQASKAIKDLVPEDCRSATWLRDGSGIRVTVNKAGSKSIKPHVGRQT